MKVRAAFLSDIHLGTRQCQAEPLVSFLDTLETEYLYLVGDIIDLWKLKSSWSWTKQHNKVIQKIIKLSNKGTKVVYVPGNHDEMFREFLPITFGNIEIQDTAEYTDLMGNTYLILHGDVFDKVIMNSKWLAVLGSYAYDVLLELNIIYNWFRVKVLKKDYWSLSLYLKHKAKEATNMMEGYKNTCRKYAKDHDYQGVITGHIHKAEIDDGYMNCGDWVESCSALIETKRGEWRIHYVKV